MTPNPAVFAPLLIASLLFFAWSCYRRFGLLALGRPEDRFERIDLRIWDMLLYAFGQKKVVEKPFGINHFVIFWGFMILLLANGEFLVRGVLPDVKLALLPEGLYHALLFAFDVVSLLTVISIAVAFGRRIFINPPYLNTLYVKARSFEAYMILSFIGLLMLAYFVLHGAEIAQGGEAAASVMPVSSFVAGLLSGLPEAALHTVIAVSWWVHAIILLIFMCYLPHSKHMHILTAIPNCFFRNLNKPNTQPPEEFAGGTGMASARWINSPGKTCSMATHAPSAAGVRLPALPPRPESRSTRAR